MTMKMNHCKIDSTVFRVYECTYERCALDHGAVHGSNSNTNLGFIKHSYIINKARDCSHYKPVWFQEAKNSRTFEPGH